MVSTNSLLNSVPLSDTMVLGAPKIQMYSFSTTAISFAVLERIGLAQGYLLKDSVIIDFFRHLID